MARRQKFYFPRPARPQVAGNPQREFFRQILPASVGLCFVHIQIKIYLAKINFLAKLITESQEHFSPDNLWELFDADREFFNLALMDLIVAP